MKNKILAAILTVTLAGVMTACGNNGGGGTADADVYKRQILPFAGKRKSWQKLNYIRMGGLHVIYLQMSECR